MTTQLLKSWRLEVNLQLRSCKAKEMALNVGSNHRIMPLMNGRLTIDKAGRVVLPKPLREELHLEPGDALDMETAGDQITLRLVRGTGPLLKEHGVWVFRAGHPMPAAATDVMLQQIRAERDRVNLGSGE